MFEYGCPFTPVRGLDEALEQMLLRSRLWNQLVEIDREFGAVSWQTSQAAAWKTQSLFTVESDNGRSDVLCGDILRRNCRPLTVQMRLHMLKLRWSSRNAVLPDDQ